ncbi:MAG: hypothetical protein R3C39_00240 [Dehalococcoidia bacterium]
MRDIASHWGAIQLVSTFGGGTLFVGAPTVVSLTSSVHPLVTTFSALTGLALFAVTVASVSELHRAGTEPGIARWLARLPAVPPRQVIVRTDGIQWRDDVESGLVAECERHGIELTYRSYRLNWRGRGDGPIQPVRPSQPLGMRGTLYCADPGEPHRLRLPDACTYGDAQTRARVLVRAERRGAAQTST